MEFFNEEQIEDIQNSSIPFPIFFSLSKEDGLSKCTHVLSVTDIGPTTVLGVPEYIELEKYNADGIVTSAMYILSDSFKAHEKHFKEEIDPEDN